MRNTTLDSDVVGCRGDGIVIGADGVRLNLGGHRVAGVGSDDEFSTGIRAVGFNDLVVRNGFVTAFRQGVGLSASKSILSKVNTDSCCGVVIGISVAGDGNTVVRNTTQGGGMGVGGDGNRVSNNLIAGATDDSWFVVSGTNSEVTHNVVRGIGGAVCRMFEFDGFDNGLIAHNTVDGGISGQVGEGECFGILGTATGSRIERNTVVGVDTGAAVFGDLLVVGNTASNNEWDGIVSGSGVTLTRNRASQNGNLGINAEFGTLDGGGNRASANGNPAQCLGVVCK